MLRLLARNTVEGKAAAVTDTEAASDSNLLICLFWGFAVSTAFLGLTIVQVYLFFRLYKERWTLNLFVTFLLLLDIASTGLSAQSLHVFIFRVASEGTAGTFDGPSSFFVEYFVTSVVTLSSQLFYALQVLRLQKTSYRRLAPAFLIVLFAVISFGGNTAATVITLDENIQHKAFANSVIAASISVGACFSTAADIVACASLTIFLVSFRSDMGRSHSSLVDSLLIFTFNRGALFTLMQMGRMAAYLANPSVWYWVPFHLLLSKLHTNSILALLNSRKALRSYIQDASGINFTSELRVSSISGQPPGFISDAKPASPTSVELRNLNRDGINTISKSSATLQFVSNPTVSRGKKGDLLGDVQTPHDYDSYEGMGDSQA